MPQLIYGLGADTLQAPIAAGGAVSAASISRPENTTAYGAGDVLGQADTDTASNAGTAILEFTKVGIPGSVVFITAVDLRIDLTAVPSGMTSFRLHLYDASPTAILDNAAWDLPAGDRSAYLGYVDVGTAVDVGSTLYVRTSNLVEQFKLAAGSSSLFGQLVTNGGYTPASATTARVRIHAVGA